MSNTLSFIVACNLTDLLVDKILYYLPTADLVKFRFLNKKWNREFALTNHYDDFWREMVLVRDKLLPVPTMPLVEFQNGLFASYNVTNWFNCYRVCSM